MSKKDVLDQSSPIFITGIGTDVGKTIVSAILCEWIQANYWKPIQKGDPEGGDSKTLKNLVSHSSFKIFKEGSNTTLCLRGGRGFKYCTSSTIRHNIFVCLFEKLFKDFP
jgi:hypothetical protein